MQKSWTDIHFCKHILIQYAVHAFEEGAGFARLDYWLILDKKVRYNLTTPVDIHTLAKSCKRKVSIKNIFKKKLRRYFYAYSWGLDWVVSFLVLFVFLYFLVFEAEA